MWNRHTAPVLDFSIDAEQPQWSQITQARADVSARYTQMQIDHFFDMLTDLPSYLVRISEQVKLEEESLRVTTKLTYQYSPQRVPPDKKDQLETLLIPLFTTKKETLIDDLSVIDGSGDQVTTLSQYDMRGLLAITLETFFQLAKKEGPNPKGQESTRAKPSPVTKITENQVRNRPKRDSITQEPTETQTSNGLSELSWDETEVLDGLIKLVCHSGIPPDDGRLKLFKSLDRLVGIDKKWKSYIEEFCSLYAHHYAIVAEVARPCTNQVALTYSQRLPQESSRNGRHNRLRRIFGLSPAKIDLPLALYAFTADSYHLQINAPPGQFIYDHRIEEMGSCKAVEKKDLADKVDPQIKTRDPARPYVRLCHEKAKTNTHLYIRHQHVSQMSELKSVFEFREIPPGTLRDAVRVAGASALIITFFALTRFGLHGPIPGESVDNAQIVKAALNSDLPAILLAIPAFVAAVVGSWSDLSRITRASLSAYAGLFSTLVLSVASVLHYILDANVYLPTEKRIPIASTSIRIEYFWLTLTAISILLFLYLSAMLRLQMNRYFRPVEIKPENKTENKRGGWKGRR